MVLASLQLSTAGMRYHAYTAMQLFQEVGTAAVVSCHSENKFIQSCSRLHTDVSQDSQFHENNVT